MSNRSALNLLAAPAIIAAVLSMASITARAEQSSPIQGWIQGWAETPFQYNVVDQDLREVFREYGRQLGMIVQLSDQVHGRVRNVIADSTAAEFLNQLANEHELVWYYDGAILHVATTSEVVMQALPVGSVSFDRLSQALMERSKADSRIGLRSGPNSDLIYVAGPASYLAFVEATAADLGGVRSTKIRIYRAGKLSGS